MDRNEGWTDIGDGGTGCISTVRRFRTVAILCLTLAACGQERVRFIPPPPERMAAVPAPVVPPATTPCAFDASKLCNTDEETAGVLAAYDDALAKANSQLEWLRNFFSAVPTAKPH